jgi:hypothetical protein
MKERTFLELLDLTLPLGGGLILRNAFATGEFKGKSYIYKAGKSWCTIYPESSSNSEEKEHIHIKRGQFHYAALFEPEKRTPQLTFWEDEASSRPFLQKEAGGKKPPFVYIFPPFYDWDLKALPIEDNQALYHKWKDQHGRIFPLIDS